MAKCFPLSDENKLDQWLSLDTRLAKIIEGHRSEDQGAYVPYSLLNDFSSVHDQP